MTPHREDWIAEIGALRRSKLKWLIGPVLAATLALGACQSGAERASELALEAEQYFQQGDLVNARRTALEATAARDDIPQIWSLLGRIEVAARNYAAALNFYSRANELDRGNIEALQTVAEISFLAGRMADADRYADELLALNPENLRAMLLKGGVALSRERDEDALAAAERVLTRDAGNEEGRLLKARAFAAGDRADEAIAFLEAELAQRGDAVASLTLLLQLQRERRDAAAVDALFRRLLALDPNNADTRLGYASELYRRGLDARGFREVDALRRDLRDDGRVMNAIAELWRSTGRDPVAPAQLSEITRDGTMSERLAFAGYAIDVGRPADALAMLEPIRGGDEVGYANVEAQVLVGRAEFAMGDVAAARARIERVHAFDPGNPRALAERVRLHMAANALDEALRDAQVLVRDNPTSPDAHLVLHEVYLRRGEPRLAESKLREGAAAIPADARLAERLTAFLIERRRLPDALRFSGQFADANPADPRGWRLRETICVRAVNAACAAEARAAIAQIRGTGAPAG